MIPELIDRSQNDASSRGRGGDDDEDLGADDENSYADDDGDRKLTDEVRE